MATYLSRQKLNNSLATGVATTVTSGAGGVATTITSGVASPLTGAAATASTALVGSSTSHAGVAATGVPAALIGLGLGAIAML